MAERPTVSVHRNAYLTRHRLDSDSRGVVGALYDSTGKLIRTSQRNIGRRDRWRVADPETTGKHDAVGKYQAVSRPEQTGADAYLERAIFGGHFVNGWGHLITESLSTAWASEALPDWPVVFVPWARVPTRSLSHRYEALRLAGWGERELILTSADCLFGTVYVPERLVRLDDCIYERHPINSAQNLVYDRMIRAAAQPDVHRPTMLTRPDGHRRAHPMEPEVTRILARSGVRVVRGWELSVQQQIAVANAASLLIGFAGSNLHNSVFGRRGIRVVEVQDVRAQTVDFSLQRSLCELRGQEFVRVSGFHRGEPRDAAAIVEDISAVLDH